MNKIQLDHRIQNNPIGRGMVIYNRLAEGVDLADGSSPII